MLLTAACSTRRSAPGSGVQLKVMSYNIHHANPPSKPDQIDLKAIAAVIAAENPDVVALQEVDVHTNRSGKIDQAAELAKMLKMEVFFARAIDYDEGQYGVAILSRLPMKNNEVTRLTTREGTKGEPRILATTVLRLPGGRQVRFGSTHLDAQRDETNRLLQAKELADAGSAEKLPFILAGDWNARPGSEPVRIIDQVFTRTCSDCDLTVPAVNPRSTIDFIAYTKSSPWEVVSHKVIPERYASDHLPVVSVLRLPAK